MTQHASTGAVAYDPADDYNGSDSFQFTVTDDAPSFTPLDTSVAVLENSGANTVPAFATSISPGLADEAGQTLTFTITVDQVNDAPSFTAGRAVTVLEDSTPYSAAWPTGISKGHHAQHRRQQGGLTVTGAGSTAQGCPNSSGSAPYGPDRRPPRT